jgi:hypothetical protein
MWPPQSGFGIVAVADWWLGRATVEVLDVAAAAATPATTTDRAKIRMASFIVGTFSKIQIDRRYSFCMLK